MNYQNVIVLTLSYSGKYLLEESISSYLSNNYPNLSIVVIDNGSTDEIVEWVKKNYPKAFILRTEKIWAIQETFILGWIKHF